MQKITPFLWFDNNVEEAVQFYTSVFKNTKAGSITRYGDAGPAPKGTVLTASITIEGQEFVFLNGGPQFKFTEAVSFMILCDSQQEIDNLWEKLTSGGGQPSQCGWLKDKFGLSWQVVPSKLNEMLRDKDAAKANRVMQALLTMAKIDLPKLEEAYNKK